MPVRLILCLHLSPVRLLLLAVPAVVAPPTSRTAAMDIVLDIADQYVLDRVWAKLVPLSAFDDIPDVHYASAAVFDTPATSKLARDLQTLDSSWDGLVRFGGAGESTWVSIG